MKFINQGTLYAFMADTGLPNRYASFVFAFAVAAFLAEWKLNSCSLPDLLLDPFQNIFLSLVNTFIAVRIQL